MFRLAEAIVQAGRKPLDLKGLTQSAFKSFLQFAYYGSTQFSVEDACLFLEHFVERIYHCCVHLRGSGVHEIMIATTTNHGEWNRRSGDGDKAAQPCRCRWTAGGRKALFLQ